jgi:hypothetical protein
MVASAIIITVVGCAGFLITRSTGGRPAPRLVFGIYPGGAVGTVDPQGATRPEDAERRLRALKQLRGAHDSFVVRLYTPYDGRRVEEGIDDEAQRQLRQYTAQGFRVELVLTYRPWDPHRATAVSGYVAFVRRAARQVGRDPRVVSLQVTNEVNVDAYGSSDVADGSYPGALDALVRGVVVAKEEARRRSLGQLRVGFNWAYESGARATSFWRDLGRAGGQRFAGAVDWVGLDIYPGTWGPPLSGLDLGRSVRNAIVGALRELRNTHLRNAGIPRSVPLHVAENGYPTGAGRTDAMQAAVATAAIRAVDEVRGKYHVTDYRWFSLRDADSASPRFESQYGLMTDAYSPKPAFWTYRSLVAKLGRTSAG